MLSKTHKLVEAITTALGPLFREESDYTTIQQAMGLVVARIAMATPRVTHEHDELEVIYIYAKKALTELLRLEAQTAAQKKKLDEGIDAFAELFADKPELKVVALNGGMGSEARAAAEELQSKYSENELEWPQYNEGSWSPDQEEAEQAKIDTYKED